MHRSNKRRGRPATPSRTAILEQALQQVRTAPEQELSISALARSLDLTPMALYRYFNDKDDLLQSMADALLQQLDITLDDSAHWQEQARQWARQLRRHFLHYPPMLRFLGWQAHVARRWLVQIGTLIQLFEQAGLTPEQFPITVKWFSATVMGLIQSEALEIEQGIHLHKADLEGEHNPQLAAVRPYREAFNRLPREQIFEYQLSMALQAIEQTLNPSRADRWRTTKTQ